SAGMAGIFLASLLMTLPSPASAEVPSIAGADALTARFAELPGWAEQDHSALLAVFRRSCQAPQPLRVGAPRPSALAAICSAAPEIASSGDAKRFFEANFAAWRIRPHQGGGFLTGYYEPEFPGSLARSDAFPTPVYARPPDLLTRMPGDDWPGFDPALTSARRGDRGLEPYPDRQAIDEGALSGKGLEILWLRDPVDRFVMQVQGSSRIRLGDGKVLRLAYSGRNGHPYTSLGRVVSEEENIPPAQMTMDKLVAKLKSDPEKARALIWRNRSFVFFRRADELPAELGPIGGEGVPLTPMLSVAADRAIWPYGLPVMLSGSLPLQDGSGDEPLARAAIIQDTGSAIIGPARIDLFYGSGDAAGHRAGLTRHPLELFVLWPKSAPAAGGG
ncbi:MAG: murein transglycosylase A, partial [Bosea sp. (in: a-proteobacteria)]